MFEDILSLFNYPFVLDIYILIVLGMFLFYCKHLTFGEDGIEPLPWFMISLRWIIVALSGSILWPVVFINWFIERFRRWAVGI